MTRSNKRNPPLRIPLTFEEVIDGILKMTPEAAREVNKTVADKRRQIDGRNKEKKLVPRSSQDLEQKEAE